MEDDEQAGGFPPRALILTIYGLYAREVGGWISVAALIELMGELGVDAPAVRSAIFRLKRREVLIGERHGGVAGYSLSDHAREILEAGDRRIFERPDVDQGGWVLAVFSVPEKDRGRRHALRARLDWLGFGTVAAGVRIAPAHVIDEARHQLVRSGLEQYVDLFIADYAAFGEPVERVRQWWDLDSLQAQYEVFITDHSASLERAQHAGSGESARRSAFVDYVATLTTWRRLPYLDPGLPASLLPTPWSGAGAAELFFALRENLERAAHDYARSVTDR